MKKEYDFSGGRRGAVSKPERGKTRITIRLDDEILDWFRTRVHESGGGNYQTLINDSLREHIGLHAEDLDERIRRIVRAELSIVAERPARKAKGATRSRRATTSAE